MTTPLTKLIAENKERPIAELPKDIGRTMFLARAIDVCNGFTDGKPYTTDYYCVWAEPAGTFARWNHNFPPTHFRPLPDDRLARVTEFLLDELERIGACYPETRGWIDITKQQATAIAEGADDKSRSDLF